MKDDQRNAVLREIGRPHVAAWLEVRQVKTLKHGDAADLMERVGAAIEAERNELQSRLAQVEKEQYEECVTCIGCGRPSWHRKGDESL